MAIPPSSRRGRLIAGQAAIVAVLIAIVYGTFLQDNEPGPLSGIDAPGPQAQLDDDRKHGGDGAGGDGGTGGGVGGGAGGGAGGAGDGGAGGAGSGPASLAGTTTPTDRQYSDTLSLLKEQLGTDVPPATGRAKRR